MSEIPVADADTRDPVPGSGGQPVPDMSLVLEGKEYEGHVVIDTVVEGQSAGGVRIADDLPLDEVRELAREMSLKYALFLLPRGGAKSGLRMAGGLTREARLAALEDFGRRLTPILSNGIYNPGMDMNCGPDELRAIYRGAGIELGRITDTSWFTAMTVFHAVEAVADRLGITSRPVTVAIEGFGSVARHLAARMDPARYRIASLATIEGAVRGREPFAPDQAGQARDAHGDQLVHHLDGDAVTREDVLTDDVDILLPSSRIWSITTGIAEAMQARAVVPIANAPYSEGTVAILHRRGVLCLPGYLSNSGGVLASSLADSGLPVPEVESLLATHYRPLVDRILHVAGLQERPGTEVTEQVARAHMPERAVSRPRPILRRIHDRFIAPRRPRGMKAAEARRLYVERSRRVLAELDALERGD